MYLCNFFSLYIHTCTVTFVCYYRKIKTKALKAAESLFPSSYFHKKFCVKYWYCVKYCYCLQVSPQQKILGIRSVFTIKFQEYYLKEIDCDCCGRVWIPKN